MLEFIDGQTITVRKSLTCCAAQLHPTAPSKETGASPPPAPDASDDDSTPTAVQ